MSTSGAFVVDATEAELNFVTTLKTVAADMITQAQDTATVAAGDTLSATSQRIELNAFEGLEASTADLDIGVGHSAEIAALHSLDVSTTTLTGIGDTMQLNVLVRRQ